MGSLGQLIEDVLATSFGIRAATVHRLPVGDSGDTFVVIGRDRRRWVAKAYAYAWWPPTELLRVRAAHRLVDHVGGRLGPVRAPLNGVSIDGSTMVDAGDHAITVQEFHEGRIWRTTDVGVQRRSLSRLGEGLAVLHSIPPGTVRVPDRRPQAVPGAELHVSMPVAAERSVAEAVRRRLLEIVDGLDWSAQHLAYVHGDVAEGNILVGPRRSLVLVDWDGLHVAPPEWDLATVALYGGDSFGSLLDGYRAASGARPCETLIQLHMGRYLLFGLEYYLRRHSAGADPTARRGIEWCLRRCRQFLILVGQARNAVREREWIDADRVHGNSAWDNAISGEGAGRTGGFDG